MKKAATLTILLLLNSFFLFSQNNNELVLSARKSYTIEEIEMLSQKDIQKINFYYTSSYSIDTNNNYYQAFIDKYCNGEFNIKYFENYRLKDMENWFSDEEFPGIKITLISWNSLEEMYKKIENSK